MFRYLLTIAILVVGIVGLGHLSRFDTAPEYEPRYAALQPGHEGHNHAPGEHGSGKGSASSDALIVPPAPFTIACSTNRHSELEPCGCARNQQGGIDREARLYQKLDQAGGLILKLEGGGFVDNLQTWTEAMKTKFMFQALHAQGTHALNVSAGDVMYGMRRLRDEASTLTLISANVREPGTHELPLDPFRVFEMRHTNGETLRVAVIGLSGPPPGGVANNVDKATMVATEVRPPATGAGVRPSATHPLRPPRTRIIDFKNPTEETEEPAGDSANSSPMLVFPEGTFDSTDNETDYNSSAVEPSEAQRAFDRWHGAGTMKGDGKSVDSHAGHNHGPGNQHDENQQAIINSVRSSGNSVVTTPSANAEALAKVMERVPTEPIDYPSSGEIVDITDTDPEIAAIKAETKARLDAMPSLEAYRRMNDRVELLDARAALDTILPEIRPRVDAVIVLWYDSENNVRAKVEGLEGVDAIVLSEVAGRYQRLADIDGTPILRGAFDGRMVSLLGLEHDADGAIEPILSMLDIQSDAETHPDISSIQLAYRLTQREEAMRRQRENPPTPVYSQTNHIYVGAQSCQDCHQEEHDTWMTTPHATAINTLIDVASEYNPDCFSCHVTGNSPLTGIPERGGFVSMDRTPHMANVQCETCHGPGWQHVTNMRRALYYERTNRQATADQIRAASVGLMTKVPSEETCLQCHTPKTGGFSMEERIAFANHSQPYPEERRENRVNNAVDMMDAFASDAAADSAK